MDENEQKTTQAGGHRFYKLLLKSMSLQLLLLPVALILTFTSYNYYYYLSAFVLPLFTHTFEKKYIFLLCTTILTFITKNIHILGLKENNMEHVLSLDAPLVEGNIMSTEQVQEAEQEAKEDDRDEIRESLEADNDQEDDGEEQGGIVDMDTEELNKKIEEFIRKMKQDLRLEAKHHLITV